MKEKILLAILFCVIGFGLTDLSILWIMRTSSETQAVWSEDNLLRARRKAAVKAFRCIQENPLAITFTNFTAQSVYVDCQVTTPKELNCRVPFHSPNTDATESNLERVVSLLEKMVGGAK